ncbi:MAG: hypothetical protein U9Q69_03960 [Nanoarchaeota archaeon]|nr:hypothetical protein [Nanoarchaeota archaeon]
MKRILILLLMAVFLVGSVSAVGTIIATGTSTHFKLDILRSEPAPAEPGKIMDLWVKVTTQGSLSDTRLFDVRLELKEEFPFSAASPEDKVKEFGTMDSSESRTVRYRVKVDGDANPGPNEIRFKFFSNIKKVGMLSAPLELDVKAISATIAVASVDLEPEKIKPGDAAKLTLTLRNDALSRLRDITAQIDLSASTMPFAPIHSTTEKKIRSIASGESVEVVYDIIALASADSKVYKVPLSLSYYDDAGTEFTKNDIIGLIVEATPDLEVNIEDFDILQKGQSGDVVVSVSNIGPSDVKYMLLKVLNSEDYTVLGKNQEYLGNLESDDFETAEFRLHIGNVKDDADLKLQLQYKDAYNNERLEQVSLKLPIYSIFELRKYGLDGDTTSFVMPIIYILIILFIYFTIKNWRKLKALDLALKGGLEDTFLAVFRFFMWFRWRNIKRLPKKIKIFFRKL